jgi:hypothetical protein
LAQDLGKNRGRRWGQVKVSYQTLDDLGAEVSSKPRECVFIATCSQAVKAAKDCHQGFDAFDKEMTPGCRLSPKEAILANRGKEKPKIGVSIAACRTTRSSWW